MIFAIIFLLIVIAYSYIQRKEPIRIAYAGGFLLAAAAISLIIFVSVISNFDFGVNRGEETVMLQTLLSTLILTPAGIIITAIGLILIGRTGKLKTAYAGLALLVTAILFFILFFNVTRIPIYGIESAALILFAISIFLIPVGAFVTVVGLVIHWIKSRQTNNL